MRSPFSLTLAGLLVGGLLMPCPAWALVFQSTGDPTFNTTAPSSAAIAGGWEYEGIFGGMLGTAIGPQHFITAAHIPAAASFDRTSLFTGAPSASFAVDSSAFSGAGGYTLPGTDLRIYKITGTFDTWASIYTGSSELGQTASLNGHGGERGADVSLASELKGWATTSTGGAPRWGTNVITGILPESSSPAGELIVMDFDLGAGANEATFSVGDSGGGLFVFDGGAWKLAGVNYAVDGAFNSSPTNAGATNLALFDMGGYWVGQDSSWEFVTDDAVNAPQQLYASRISSHAGTIQSIVGVPEPSALLLLAGLAGLPRRRR
jgi:hypothetical protein